MELGLRHRPSPPACGPSHFHQAHRTSRAVILEKWPCSSERGGPAWERAGTLGTVTSALATALRLARSPERGRTVLLGAGPHVSHTGDPAPGSARVSLPLPLPPASASPLISGPLKGHSPNCLPGGGVTQLGKTRAQVPSAQLWSCDHGTM